MFQISKDIGNVNTSVPRSYTCRQLAYVRSIGIVPKNLEAVLPVAILFQKGGIIDDDLCVSYLQVHDLVIDRFCGFDSAYRFLQINIERPQLQGLE